MIKIFEDAIHIGVESNPLFKALMPIEPKFVVKAQIMTDMTTLFIAIIKNYGESEVADMIDKALHTAIKHKDDVEVKNINHDTDNT